MLKSPGNRWVKWFSTSICAGLLLFSAPAGAEKKPFLTLTGPYFVMLNDYSGRYPKGIVPLRARIQGEINEKWYCPRLVWVWPNGTRSSEEADCPAFSPEGVKDSPRTWTRTVTIPEGNWEFYVEAWKGNTRLATASWRVKVGNPEQQQEVGW